jgi:hypothetical protein
MSYTAAIHLKRISIPDPVQSTHPMRRPAVYRMKGSIPLSLSAYQSPTAHTLGSPTDPSGNTMYPERASSNVGRTRGKLLSLQTESLNVNNANDAIWVSEWNANDNGNLWWRQTMGAMMSLFTTTLLAEHMQAGVRDATWYAQSLSNVCMIYNHGRNGEGACNW